MKKEVLRWFGRLLIWPFFASIELVKGIGEQETMAYAVFCTFGILLFGGTLACFSILSLTNLLELNTFLLSCAGGICLLLYFLLGLVLFFKFPFTNAPVPWYQNGGW